MNNDDPAASGLFEEESTGEREPAPVVLLPLAVDVDTPIPALRDIRAQMVKLDAKADAQPGGGGADGADDEDKTVVVLADPEGLAPQPAMLSPAAFALASLFNGERSARQAAEELGAQVGQPVSPQNVLELQRKLDEALFLYSEHFGKTVRRMLRTYLDKSVRPAVHAGTAYPAAPEQLQHTVAGYFSAPDGPGAPWEERPAATAAALPGKAPHKVAGDTVRALILPHIDLRVGGATYAHGYAELLRHCQADLFVILGVAHQAEAGGSYYVSVKDFATPLGPVKTAHAIARHLQAGADTEPVMAELAHRTEHSVEFQAVLLAATLARYKRDFEIVPVLCGPVETFLAQESAPMSAPPFKEFTTALREELDGSKRKWCVLCSVDWSHVGPEFGNSTMMTPRLLPPMERYDRNLLKLVGRLDLEGFYREIARTQNSRHVDAVMSVLTMLRTCEGLLKHGRLLHYDQMLKEGSHSAVSYAAMAFE
ncbi:MAG: AmmeMemoRadiSam system protein B [Planctomycetota bacterium]